MNMVYIYVLKLKSNKYYVGKTDNPNFRLNDHFDANGSEWKECDSNYNQYGIQLRIKLSEMRNIYQLRLKYYQDQFKILTETDMTVDNINLDHDIFRIIDMIENCEKIINKFKGKNFYGHLLRELAELFYDCGN